VYVLLSIPITLIVRPMERIVLQRLLENTGDMPPEFREYVRTYVGGRIRFVLGFILMLFAGSIFSTLGGLFGAVIFRKPLAPGTVDVPPSA